MLRDLYKGIAGIQRNSFIDFPGTASAVLFYGGCNLRCPYCHNSSLIDETGEDLNIEAVDAFLRKRKGMLDGVVLTGGEPTLHANMPKLMEYLQKELGYKVKLDTNGLNPAALKLCSPDYLAMDMKALPSKYATHLQGPANAWTLLSESLKVVKAMGGKAEVRITAAPGVVDEDDFAKLFELLDGVRKVYIQQFQTKSALLNEDFFAGRENYQREELEAIVSEYEMVSVR